MTGRIAPFIRSLVIPSGSDTAGTYWIRRMTTLALVVLSLALVVVATSERGSTPAVSQQAASAPAQSSSSPEASVKTQPSSTSASSSTASTTPPVIPQMPVPAAQTYESLLAAFECTSGGGDSAVADMLSSELQGRAGSPRLVEVVGSCPLRFYGPVASESSRPQSSWELIAASSIADITPNDDQVATLREAVDQKWRG